MTTSKIITDTAPQASLVELMLIHNDIPVVRKQTTTHGQHTSEEFMLPDNIGKDWIQRGLQIERQRLRTQPENRVTFENMTLQNGRNVYSKNADNEEAVRMHLKAWVLEVQQRFINEGKQSEMRHGTQLLAKLDDSTRESVMGVFEEILNWEGGLD